MSSETSSGDELDHPENNALLRNMEARADRQKIRNYNVLYGVTTVVGAVTVILTFVWCVHFRGGFSWSSQPNLEFNWHPLLMVFGLIFLYGQSILVYRTGRTRVKKQLKLWHAGILFLAFVLSVVGLKAVFDSHNYAVPPKANMYTLHSWIGLVTVILFASQFLIGFISFLFPGLNQTLRAAILPVHTQLGTAIFSFAIVAALIGYAQKAIWALGDDYQNFVSEGVFINFLGILLLCFGVLVLYLVNDVTYKRENLAEDDMTLVNRDD